MIRVVWACGHRAEFNEGSTPSCPRCGERRIARTEAPPPTFRGVCLGPTATYEDLPGVPVVMGKKES